METTTTYFVRRARQERQNAVNAVSAEARSAHLELALRLVTAATDPQSLVELARSGTSRSDLKSDVVLGVRKALRKAFVLPLTDTFQRLLEGLDRSSET